MSASHNAQSIWLGFAERRPTHRGTTRVHLRWGRLAGLLGALLALAWGFKTVALYYFYKEIRAFEAITWQDVFLWPTNRANVRVAQGNYQIEAAKTKLETGELRSAFALLQTGVARSPAHVEGRLLLAQIYQRFRPDLTRALLEQGLDTASDDLDYIRFYAQVLFQARDDDAIVAWAQALLPETPELSERNTILALAAMRAALNRGQFPLLVDYFQAYGLHTNQEGITLLADALQRTGQGAQAIAMLETFVQQFGDAPVADPVLQRLAGIYLEQGDPQAAIERALRRALNAPLAWPPRLDLIRLYHATGREGRIPREIEAMMRQFRDHEPAMAAMARLASDLGDVALAHRLYEAALERGFSVAVFGLLFVESHLTSGQYQAAIELCNELSRERPAWLPPYEGVLNSMRAIAYYGIGNVELGSIYLADFLAAETTTAPLLISIAHRFRESGRPLEAQQILQRAWALEDNNVAVLTRLLEVDLALGDARALATNVRHLLALQRPSYDLVEALAEALASDRFVFTPERAELLAHLAALLAERDAGVAALAAILAGAEAAPVEPAA